MLASAHHARNLTAQYPREDSARPFCRFTPAKGPSLRLRAHRSVLRHLLSRMVTASSTARALVVSLFPLITKSPLLPLRKRRPRRTPSIRIVLASHILESPGICHWVALHEFS